MSIIALYSAVFKGLEIDLSEEEMEQNFHALMASCTLLEREEYVLSARVLNDKKFDEIAEELDTTHERVRQIEAKAIKKLQYHTRKAVLWPNYRNAKPVVTAGNRNIPNKHISPTRELYNAMFIGEDLSSMPDDEMKENLKRVLDKLDLSEDKKAIAFDRLISETSFKELSKKYFFSEGYTREIVKRVERRLRRNDRWVLPMLLTGYDTYSIALNKKEEYEEKNKFSRFTLNGKEYEYLKGNNLRENALNLLDAWMLAMNFPIRERMVFSQYFGCMDDIERDPVDFLIEMTPELMMLEIPGCTASMAQEVEKRLKSLITRCDAN